MAENGPPDYEQPPPPPAPQSPGNTGTTTSTSSTPASTGPTAAEKMAMQRLRASFMEILRRWGIKPDKNLLNLVERGIRGMWTTTQFMGYVRETPEYRQQFRGMRWRQGMTEGQYNALFARYKERAGDIGENLTRKEFAKLLKRGVDFDEFSDRVDALNAITEYGPMWKQFLQVLQLQGVPIPKDGVLQKKELQKFIMGLGDQKWEEIYEETVLTTNLEKVAGVEVIAPRAGEKATPDTYGIMRQDLLAIIKQVEALTPGFELESLTSQDWAQIGKNLRQYSIEYLNRYGITTKDLLEMELGGPNAAKIAERAERLLKTQEAFKEPRAVPQWTMGIGKPQDEEELPQSL